MQSELTFRHAIVREVSDAITRYGADATLARRQHHAYVGALREASVEVHALPASPELPDCCFVEDTAVIDGNRALLTRMGYAARRPETEALREALAGFEITEMEAPATLDGGDVLRIGDKVYVGRSGRTNRAGIQALRDFLGKDCIERGVRHCLHLKTGCTLVAPDTVLVNPEWVQPPPGVEVLEVLQPNALLVNGICLVSNPAVERVLERRGIPAWRVDISEFKKADGGLTCLSLLLEQFPQKSV